MKIGRKISKTAGFTIVEIMVVVAMVAIVTAIATPSLRRFIVSSDIRSAVNDWNLALQTARSEAVRRRTSVTVCPSSNGSTCTSTGSYHVGWVLMLGDGSSAGSLLQDFLPRSQVKMTASITGPITYLATGTPIGTFTGLTMKVEENSATPDDSLTRYLCMARSGRARMVTQTQYSSGTCV